MFKIIDSDFETLLRKNNLVHSKIVNKIYPAIRKIIVVHPPERKSKELCKVADAWFAFGKNRLKQNQLPLQIETEKNIITKPSYWN